MGDRCIGDDTPAYVCAEIGHNHGGSVHTAKKLIRAASRAGADAVKFQKRDLDTLYSPAMLNQPYVNPNSFGDTYGAHRRHLEFDRSELWQCQREAHEQHVACFATAFDEPSADVLVSLGMPAIKLASGSLTDHALLAYVASLGVPVILSTGGGTAHDIDVAVNLLAARVPLALLHCTAAYPVLDYAELNLACIGTLWTRYPDCVIGWSGHDSGIAMALVAYALGARIIEKHFTLNRASKGTDHAFSLEPVGLTKLCRDLARGHEALGDGVKRFYLSEGAPLAKMRRTSIDGRWQIGTSDEQRVHAERV